MIHGEEQLDQSTSGFQIVNGPENADEGERTGPVIATNDSTAQEEKERVFQQLEREMEIFRKGEYTRFQASSRVANELGKWAGASDKEREKAFDSYLTEINSLAAVPNGNRSTTRETSPPAAATLHTNQQPRGKHQQTL